MRIRTALLSALAALMAMVSIATAAEAQTFFQKVFGFGGAPSASQPVLRTAPQTLPAYRFQSRASRRAPRPARSSPASADDDIGPPDSGGPYRTVCVRACDGFYFPLRHNAQHKNFASDTRSCRAACGSEAQLFYYAETGGSAETMVDVAGRKYAGTRHAFAYRKAIVPNCTCKPEPWSAEENARHQSYADIEARELIKDEAFVKARAAAAAAVAPDASAPSEPETKDTIAPAAEEPLVTTPVDTTSADVLGAETPAPPAVEPKRTRAAGYRRAVRSARPVTQRVRYRLAGGGTYYVVSRGAYAWPRQRR
jgi:Protein of unknown function (DUF2865)